VQCGCETKTVALGALVLQHLAGKHCTHGVGNGVQSGLKKSLNVNWALP